jgi:hypothetical protein
MRRPLEVALVEPPSPVATELQKRYLPPRAVNSAAPNVIELPVPILDVGAKKELSPIHHSVVTDDE